MELGDVRHPRGQEGSPPPVLLADRFLGSRFMGDEGGIQTWRGVDLSSGAPVILKEAPVHRLRPGARERMLREDAALRELHSPRLLPPLFCREDGERFHQVQSDVSGRTLGDWIAQGPLSVEQALQVGCGLLRALRELHECGALHRHLSPSNIIVSERGTPCEVALTGFGLAPDDLREAPLQALPLAVVPYLSPEQTGLMEGAVGPPADLYATGVLLFECLAGAPPFQGDSLGEVLRQHLAVSPELRARGLPVPRALEQVVRHLLCKDPRERYQSAQAALEDLEAIAAALQRGEREPDVGVGLTDVRHQLTEPSFIGRQAELEALEGALAAAITRHGGFLLLEGESGVGKTVLLDELARRAQALGVRIFRGRGTAHTAQRPLQALHDVFQRIFSDIREEPALAGSLREDLGDQLEAVCAAIPSLAAALQCHPSPEPQERDPLLSGLQPEALGETRVVRALSAVFDSLGGAGKPALVLLDDCQWSDALTLKVLSAWARALQDPSACRCSVLMVVSFRTEEVPEGHPLRSLASLAHVIVQPFASPDVRRLAESMAGQMPEEALTTVEQLSQGNPFMASAVVRGLVETGAVESTDEGWRIEPRRLAEVQSSRRATSFLLRRLELLPTETRRLLEAGAILGREFEVEWLATIAGYLPERATAMLEEARRRHVLWTDGSASRYAFTHDRLREALLGGLSNEERRALHLATANELARRAPERTFELAWHFEEAGRHDRAWPHALKAALEARRLQALELAERYYRIADAGAVSTDAATRLSILEGLGRVLLIQGKYVEADGWLAQALRFATTRLERARLEGLRGEAAFWHTDLATADSWVRRALHTLGHKVPRHTLTLALGALWATLLHGLRSLKRRKPNGRLPLLEGEARLAVRLYIVLGSIFWHWHQRGPILACYWTLVHGLKIIDRHAPGLELATMCVGRGCGSMAIPALLPRLPGFMARACLKRGKRYFEKAFALYEASGDPFERCGALFTYNTWLLWTGQCEECIRQGRTAEALQRRAGDMRRALLVHIHVGLALYFQGDLPAAAEQAREVYREAQAPRDVIARRQAVATLAFATAGRLQEELMTAERGRPIPPEEHFPALARALLLHAEGVRLLGVDLPDKAEEVFAQAIEQFHASHLRIPLGLPFLRLGLVIALRKQAARLPPHAFSRRAALLRQARSTAQEVLRRPAPSRLNYPGTLRELGLIAAMEGHDARARRFFSRSLAYAERLGMRYERARTLQARAEVGTDLGWPTAAADTLASEEALRPLRAALEPAEVDDKAEPSLSLVDRFPRVLEAGRAVATALTREAIFTATGAAVRGLLRSETFALAEATPEGPALPEGFSEALRPVARRAWEARRPVVPSSEELEGMGDVGMRSVLCTPVLMRGQVVACFWAAWREVAGAFGPQEARIAEFIATLAGAALENARGFAEVRALSEERERLYQQARAALRKRDEFLAVASHELRTPFTPMRLYMQSLLQAMRQPARAAGLETWVAKLDLANARLQKLARLVEDLFEVSRLSQGTLPIRPQEVDLAALAADAIERWKEELARVKCECRLEASGPVVGSWDGVRLEQVLDNLLANAMKYGPGKPVHMTVRKQGALALLVVRDEGIGIAPEDQERIFERFERAVSEENYGGFGLGLWIAREVVRAHGGRIGVASVPGQGATFTVELPLARPQGSMP